MSDGNNSVFFCCNYKRRCLFISKQEHSINEEIRDEKVRLIGADGAQLGILSAKEALKKAEAADMDLVKIAPNSDPPVCKIMDYGKYKFDQVNITMRWQNATKFAIVTTIMGILLVK